MKLAFFLTCPVLLTLALPFVRAAVPVPGATVYTENFNTLFVPATGGNIAAAPAWSDLVTVPQWRFYYAGAADGAGVFGGAGFAYNGCDGSVAPALTLVSGGAAGDSNRFFASPSTTGRGEQSGIVVFENTSPAPVRLTSLAYTGRALRANATANNKDSVFVWTRKAASETEALTMTTGAVNTTVFPAAVSTAPTSYYITGWNELAQARFTYANAAGSAVVNASTPAGGTLTNPITFNPGEFLAVRFSNINDGGTDALIGIDDLVLNFEPVDCVVDASVVSVVRDAGFDPSNPEDDTVSFTLKINGAGAVSPAGWKIAGPAASSLAGQTGPYGNASFSGVPIAEFNGGLALTIEDAESSVCFTSLTVFAAAAIGSNAYTGTPLFSNGAAIANWVIDEAARTAKQNASVQADRVVTSEIIDVSGIGYAAVTADLEAITGTSGFEATDSFALDIIIDGGTPVSMLGAADTNGNGRLSGLNDLAGPGTELPSNDEPSTTRSFSFKAIVPESANTVQIRFIGNSNSTGETLIVKNITLGPPPPTIHTTLQTAPAVNHQGTADPADDTFTAAVNIIPLSLDFNTGWISSEPPPLTGLYTEANPVVFGPYPVAGGARDITLTDTMDAAASGRIRLTPPVAALTVTGPSNIRRHENGAGPADDSVSFDLMVEAPNAGPGWTVTGALEANGAYGPVTLTIPAPLPAGPVSLTFTDVSYPSATRAVTVAIPGRYVIGRISLGGGPADLLTDLSLPPAVQWVNDVAARTLVMSAGVAADSLVTSEVIDLTAAGQVYFTAKLKARETSTGSNFESTDRFKAELIIDGGLPSARVVNLVDAYDTGDGASATAVATGGLNGPKNGYLNGYNGTIGRDLLTNISYTATLAEYNANRDRDEFNTGGETGDKQMEHDFALQSVIPAGASRVQLVIAGAGVASSEFLTVSEVLFSLQPPVTAGDQDGDGVSNADELIMGTDPGNAGDVLRPAAQNPANPGAITFSTKTGRYYRVYMSDDTDGSESSHLLVWKDAGLASIAGDGNPAGFTIEVKPGERRRFYRLHVMTADGPWPATVP